MLAVDLLMRIALGDGLRGLQGFLGFDGEPIQLHKVQIDSRWCSSRQAAVTSRCVHLPGYQDLPGPYSAPKVIHGWRGDWLSSPQPAVNNFAAPNNLAVNNSTFTRTVQVNTPGPEDECQDLNARRFSVDFRSGPGALMQRNSQSLSPASLTDRDEPAIRSSIHQSPRVQNNALP